ncbi:hypothetical protein [Rhizobium sp. YTU87027]|uniref:hypothetical protein n=1 Tax=Rhizobium sp. YTU87027 TaxID=3417741 RepID=UPI003D688635
MLALVSNAAVRNSTALARFNENTRVLKQAASSLAVPDAARPMLVGSNTIAFYAKVNYLPFPYCDAYTALKYFSKKKVRFLALSSEELAAAPYLREWWQNGIPALQ